MAYNVFVLDSSKNVVGLLRNTAWEATETLNIEDRMALKTTDVDKFSLLRAEGSHVRLVNDEDATDIRTYRVQNPSEVHSESRVEMQLECARIWAEMGGEIFEPENAVPFRNISASTLAGVIFAQSQFQAGATILANDAQIDELDGVYKPILEIVQAMAEKLDLELSFDESTSPETVDLVTRGSDNGVRIDYGKTAKGIIRTPERLTVFNKVFGIGGNSPPATAKGARFEVYSVSTTTITVAQDKCIPSNDAFNTTYDIEFVSGTLNGNRYQITDCARGAGLDSDTITTATDLAAAGAAVGDLFKFVLNADGSEIAYVEDPASQTAYAMTRETSAEDTTIENADQLFNNGFLDGGYTANLADGWTKSGSPTLAKETDTQYIQHGNFSQYVSGVQGEYIEYQVTLAGGNPYSFATHIYVSSGNVEIRVIGDQEDERFFGETAGVGTWHTTRLENISIEGATATVRITCANGPATFWLDAVVAAPGTIAPIFTRLGGARELYRRAFDKLEQKKDPEISYQIIDPLDNYMWDSAAYEFQKVVLGDTVRIVDPVFSTDVSARVLSITRNQLRRVIGITIATQTYPQAAFMAVAPNDSEVVRLRTASALALLNTDMRNLQQTVDATNQRVQNWTGHPSLGSVFSGTITSTSKNSLDIEDPDATGISYVRQTGRAEYPVADQTISGLDVDDIYYLYVTPGDVSSGMQYTKDVETAYSPANIFVATIRTGATDNDSVQIWVGGKRDEGEVRTRGFEAYDNTDTLRIDIGILNDPSAAYNPSDWGINIVDGVLYQESNLAAWGGGDGGVMRGLWANFGDVDGDLTYDASTNQIWLDYIWGAARMEGGVGGSFGLYGSQIHLSVQAATSDGHLWAHRVGTALNVGSGNVYAYSIGSITTQNGGDCFGVYVGDGLGVRSTSTGDAYGVYIAAVSSTGGSAFCFYDASGERAYFAGSQSWRGVNYVMPAADAAASGYVLSSDGAGNLSWVAGGSGTVSGSGTLDYIPIWTSASSLGDSIISSDGFSGLIAAGKFASTESFWVDESDTGTITGLFVRNQDNTNTAAHALVSIAAGGASGGDPFFRLYSGATYWSFGVDNSDSDKFKIAQASLLGGSTGIEIDTSLNVTVPNGVFGVGAAPTYSIDAYLTGNGYKGRFWNGTQGIALYVASTGDFITSWGAESIGFGVGGNQKVWVDSSGNFGVGAQATTGKIEAISTSAGANTVGLALGNLSASANTAISLDFTAYTAFTTGRIQMLNQYGTAAQNMLFWCHTGGSLIETFRLYYNGVAKFYSDSLTVGLTQITTAQDSPINIQSVGYANAWIGFNTHYDAAYYCGGGTTSAWMVYHAGTELFFYGDSSLTPGSTYTPNVRIAFSYDGSLVVNTANAPIKARYATGGDNYHASMRWAGLQLGNNGVNRIVAGRTVAGGTLAIYTNNTNDAADYTVSPDGTLSFYFLANGDAIAYQHIGVGGKTPSTWNASYHVIEWFASSLMGNVGNYDCYWNSNIYNDAGGSWRYIASAAATVVGISTIGLQVYTAPAGTGGNVATLTTQFFVQTDGDVAIQTIYPGQSSVTGLGFSYTPVFHVHDANNIGLTPTLSSSLQVVVRFVDTDGSSNIKAADIFYTNQVFNFRSITDAGAVKYDNVLVVDTNQNRVGIGKAPGQILDVHNQGANCYVGVGTNGTTFDAGILFYESTTTFTGFLLHAPSTSQMKLGTVIADDFILYTGNTARMYWDGTNGNIGIFTANSNTVGINMAGTITAAGVSATAFKMDTTLVASSAAESQTLLWVDGTFNFGAYAINTGSAIYVYDIATSGAGSVTTVYGVYIAEQTGGTTNNYSLFVDGHTRIQALTQIYDSTVFASGSVLQVINNNGSTAAALNCLYGGYLSVAPNNTSHYFQVWVDSGATRAYMTSDGGWYNNGTYGTISDRRLKTDIRYLEDIGRSYWADWKLLKFAKFKMKEDVGRHGRNAHDRFGVIAQDIQAVFPALISTGPDGTLQIKQSVLQTIGMKVIQETQTRVESLEERVRFLEKENMDLRKVVDALKSAA